MKNGYYPYPKRDPKKNFFMVPNEVFSIGLSYQEISLYTYLLRCESRENYQCYPSYKTIGKSIGMSENTVAKYVRSLEEKGLIYTEPTIVRSCDGRPLNGTLLYTIRPIQYAIDLYYERQLRQMDEELARQQAVEHFEKFAAQSRQNAPCASFREDASPSPTQGLEGGFASISEEFAGQTGFPPKPSKAGSVGEGGAA